MPMTTGSNESRSAPVHTDANLQIPFLLCGYAPIRKALGVVPATRLFISTFALLAFYPICHWFDNFYVRAIIAVAFMTIRS